jgi:hypothetical protein
VWIEAWAETFIICLSHWRFEDCVEIQVNHSFRGAACTRVKAKKKNTRGYEEVAHWFVLFQRGCIMYSTDSIDCVFCGSTSDAIGLGDLNPGSESVVGTQEEITCNIWFYWARWMFNGCLNSRMNHEALWEVVVNGLQGHGGGCGREKAPIGADCQSGITQSGNLIWLAIFLTAFLSL